MGWQGVFGNPLIPWMILFPVRYVCDLNFIISFVRDVSPLRKFNFLGLPHPV